METKKWKSEKQILNELKEENSQLKKQITSQQQTIERLSKALTKILKLSQIPTGESVGGRFKRLKEIAKKALNTTEPIDQ